MNTSRPYNIRYENRLSIIFFFSLSARSTAGCVIWDIERGLASWFWCTIVGHLNNEQTNSWNESVRGRDNRLVYKRYLLFNYYYFYTIMEHFSACIVKYKRESTAFVTVLIDTTKAQLPSLIHQACLQSVRNDKKYRKSAVFHAPSPMTYNAANNWSLNRRAYNQTALYPCR